MFSFIVTFHFLTFSNIFLRVKTLEVLPKVEVDDLVRTEEIIRNTTNGILSNLRFPKPVNSTRIKEFSIIHKHFMSVTFQSFDNLKEIVTLTRVDRNKFNNSTNNLTTILNDFLNEDQCDFKINSSEEVGFEDNDVAHYVDSFLAKLDELKENYGVNKVITDINSNIIKLLEESRRSERGNESHNYTMANETKVDDYTVLDNDFWMPSGRRIYKGTRTKIKYYPFMASVHIFNTFQCAGSIVKSDLVITASSCLQLAWNNRFYRENPAFLSVRVGSSFYNGGGENIPVLEIYFHPDYNPKNLWNNVCLLRLLRHVRFLKKTRKSVKKIAIDKHPWSLPTNTPGITIIGWGAKGRSNTLADPWVNILSFAMLDVYPLRECQEVYSKEYVTRNNFCGGFFAKGSGACNRDVGAPGVVDGVLVGVVSFGSPVCGTPDAPTVFTKLGYYYSWIQTIMKLKIPRTKKKSTPRLDPDPLGPYRTTKITTTTFRIEPLEEGELPISVTDERDPDSFLRTLDDKLFLEFLETMFGGKEVKKYENLLKQKAKILRDPSINTTTKEQTTEPNEQGREARTELFIPEEFESDIPHTQLIPFENTAVTEEYTQVTDDSDERDARNKNFYNPTQKHKPNIKRNKHKGKHIKKIPTTLETPREIFLELATESSDDSDQSLPLQSGINLVLSKESSDKSSSEDSDISGEQVIADLLDEIDLNEILKEATASTISSKSFQNYGKRDSVRNRYVAPITTDVPQTYNYNKKLPNKVSKGKIKTVNDKKDSILTLLYLTDSEKKHNTNSYVGNVRVERSNTPFTATTECNGCSKVYNIVPKSEIYKIISRVLKAAIVNKA